MKMFEVFFKEFAVTSKEVSISTVFMRRGHELYMALQVENMQANE